MNEKFLELPEERRLAIINAAIEIFGRFEYKKASTDDIAAKAGISKGLLFYYFHNKKTLYLYIVEYIMNLIEEQIVSPEFCQIDDFFEVLLQGGKDKYRIILKHPYLTEFSVRAYYSKMEEISAPMQEYMKKKTVNLMSYFRHVDMTKFKEDVNPQEILNMLFWMADGYIRQFEIAGIPLDLDALMKEFYKWSEMFKKLSYREEFL